MESSTPPPTVFDPHTDFMRLLRSLLAIAVAIAFAWWIGSTIYSIAQKSLAWQQLLHPQATAHRN
jgi:hypothetical protein